MQDVKIKNNIGEDLIKERGVKNWPVWEKEPSSFPWSYSDTEECYIIEGEADIEVSDGSVMVIQAGDFVTFAKGLSCFWTIKKKIVKHYNFI